MYIGYILQFDLKQLFLEQSGVPEILFFTQTPKLSVVFYLMMRLTFLIQLSILI